MARTHGRVDIGIWANRDVKKLTKDAQRAYVMLLSQPQINNCGVVPYVPKRWVKLAADETDQELEQALHTLVDLLFIVLDEHTDEVLIRTFIKHDRIEKQPNLVKAAKREFGDILSTRIQRVLLAEYPQLFDEVASEDLRKPLPEPLFTEGLPEGVREPLPRASARSHARAPAPSPGARRADGEEGTTATPEPPAALEAPPALRVVSDPEPEIEPLPPDESAKQARRAAELLTPEKPDPDREPTAAELAERERRKAASAARLHIDPPADDADIPLR